MTSSNGSPERTVLYDTHVAAGAQVVDFHGWAMPLRYRSIPEEHLQVRSAAGLFDLCHMGRIELRGAGAEAWLDGIVCGDVGAMRTSQARYTLILNESGTVIDDAVVYRLADRWLLVVNASNRARVVEWMQAHRPTDGADAELIDLSATQAMIAIQGPSSLGIVGELVQGDIAWERLGYYHIAEGQFNGTPVLVARTGYTGEDGFEVYLPGGQAAELWNATLRVGGDRVTPIGLGARDTLRLEAGMPLYGNEIDETTTPYEAGLKFAVKLEKHRPFIGRDALRSLAESKPRRRLRGFRVEGGRVARQGMRLLLGSEEVGVVTSGAPSPTLGYPIAMGYLDSAAEAAIDAGDARAEELCVDLRGRPTPVERVRLPFYSRTRKSGS